MKVESMWLKGLMQNEHIDENFPETESEHITEMREEFFENLPNLIGGF